MSYFGIQDRTRENCKIFLHQEPYAIRKLDRFKMLEAFPVFTPMENGQRLGEDAKLGEKVPSHSAVGSLIATRPVRVHRVNFISQSLKNPKRKVISM
ncbi:hypothetical protein JTB14_008341 [Gonioctena quinquepunctata]|nr:hypothetical protein JTB14_008341 [Gonioctena quinquepunctata]